MFTGNGRGHGIWDPLWKNQRPKELTEREDDFISALAMRADLILSHIEPVLDVKGNKQLRIKMFVGVEHAVEMYDYFFFGNIVEIENRVCCQIFDALPQLPPRSRKDDHWAPKQAFTIMNAEALYGKDCDKAIGRKKAGSR